MSALWDYANELRRRGELLEAAAIRDDATFAPDQTAGSGRKHRTRVDANRFAEYCEQDDQFAERTDSILSEITAAQSTATQHRTYTRVDLILLWYERHPIRSAHAAALAEAQETGLYPIIAPLLRNMTLAHERLLAVYRDDDGNLYRAERLHQEAVEALLLHLPCKLESDRRQSDTKSDTSKKIRKMNTPAVDCCRIYGQQKVIDPTYTMKQVVSEYIESNGGSFNSIMRILNDNPSQWKNG